MDLLSHVKLPESWKRPFPTLIRHVHVCCHMSLISFSQWAWQKPFPGYSINCIIRSIKSSVESTAALLVAVCPNHDFNFDALRFVHNCSLCLLLVYTWFVYGIKCSMSRLIGCVSTWWSAAEHIWPLMARQPVPQCQSVACLNDLNQCIDFEFEFCRNLIKIKSSLFSMQFEILLFFFSSRACGFCRIEASGRWTPGSRPGECHIVSPYMSACHFVSWMAL